MGYLFLSLLLLVRGTWHQAMRTLKPVDTAAALASGSTTRPLPPQPWASALPFLLGSGRSPFEATHQPSCGPPKAVDLRPDPRTGTISRNRRGAWLGRSSAVAGAIFRNPANPPAPTHPTHPTHPRRPRGRLGAARGQRRKQWEVAVGGGLAWRAAYRYAWLVLLLILIYQVVVGSG